MLVTITFLLAVLDPTATLFNYSGFNSDPTMNGMPAILSQQSSQPTTPPIRAGDWQPATAMAYDRLSLHGLPAVLDEPEVSKALQSGLTTTLLISLQAAGNQGGRCSRSFAAQVRFDLWDEAFLLRWSTDENSGTEAFDSKGALRNWWSGRKLTCVQETFGSRQRMTVKVDVSPFSAEEVQDARGWFTKSTVGGRSPGAAGGSLLELVLSSSIRSSSIFKQSWSETVDLGGN